jgi:hypothetical protein
MPRGTHPVWHAAAVPVLILTALSGGCMAPPAGSPETGYAIHGFVGQSSTQAAPGETVKLLAGEGGELLAMTQSNFMGKYSFSGLQPGHYRLQVGPIVREVLLKNENQRLDIDLSSPTGSMNYATGALQETMKPGSGKPTDAALMQEFAGQYYGYSGSTESKMALCPDGRYFDTSESSYSGQSYNSGGDPTMAWGTANQSSGSGSWAIQGSATQGTLTITYPNGSDKVIQYQSTGEKGCYRFDGVLMCYSGAANCK